MIISAEALNVLISFATLAVAATPVILVIMWLVDKKGGKLW